MKIAQIVGIVVGVGLMAAPAVWGYAGSTASDVQRTLGPIAAAAAIIAIWAVTSGVRWLNLLVAFLLVVSAFVVDQESDARLVALASGVLLGLATPFGSTAEARVAGGWSVLFRLDEPDGEAESGRER